MTILVKKIIHQQGFSLVELMIASVLGLVIFGGMINLLIASDEVTDDTVQNGELQEMGSFALNLISQDIMLAGYWGPMTKQSLDANNINVNLNGVATTADCVGEGGNNSSFPSDTVELPFRYIWANIADNVDELGCIPDAKVNSAILQIKRGLGEAVNVAKNNRYYLTADTVVAHFFAGNDAAAVPVLNASLTMEYQHYVYYVRSVQQGDHSIPILSRLQLEKADSASASDGKMIAYDMVEGVEYINFLMGLDKDGDLIADVFLPIDKMDDRQYWDQTDPFSLVAVKVFVIVRSLRPDAHVNNEFTYHLGDWSFTAPGDHYRRMLFSNTITIANAGENSWSE